MTDVLGEGKISALDLAANYKEFAEQIKKQTNPEFLNLGMKLTGVIIENISLPEEVEKALDEKTRLGMMEDHLDTYTRLKTADAIGDAAKNPGNGGLAGLGVGLGAGNLMGQMFAQNMVGQQSQPQAPAKGKTCAKCGATVPARAKFCPECGEKTTTKSFCPECGAEVKKTAKFCSECGKKLGE